MFRKTLLISCMIPVLAACGQPDLEPRAAETRTVVKEFMQSLKGELQTAMQAGGPVNAIAVCNEVAPGIAADISEKHQWQVGRTSLKLRNANNAPDDWEKTILMQFETRKSAGEDPKALEHFEIVKMGDRKMFRYMKAIPTAEVCLACHGENVAAPVSEKLQELYPQDKATGYKAGDIRGAFTIVTPL